MLFAAFLSINDFLQGLEEGFRKTPTEISFFIIFVISIIIVSVLIAIINYLVGKRRLFKELKEKYLYYLNEFGLNREEEKLIEMLSIYLKTPGKKYLLFVNQHVFNHCLSELKRRRPVDNEILLPLVKKLGFNIANPYHVPRSSRELMEKKAALLVMPSGEKFAGIIEKQLSASLVFSATNESKPPLIGSNATFYTHNAFGILSFSTIIQNIKDKEIYLAHSEKVSFMQRRQNYRKQIILPIFIKQEGSNETPLQSAILDLSAGGISVKNPLKKFKKGDDLKLFFHKDTNIWFDLYGEVVRLSKNHDVLHIRFGYLIKSMQDQIIRLLNTEKENKKVS
jgi:hypothetical protein